MTFIARFLFVSLVVGSLTQFACCEAPFDESRLEATELVTQLTRPMELAVAPDGRVFHIELGGQLKVYEPSNGQVSVVGEIKVFQEQENGLIGLALDPNFDQNQRVFLQYSPPDYPGQHISRFTLSNGKLDMASEKVLLKFKEQRVECCHHAGSLQFGPDGCLFIGTGDNTHPGGDSHGFAPIDERPGKFPWDAQKSAANTNQRSGKILRIRPTEDGSYEIPEGNLFPPDGSQGKPEIYVMGCRNPWRLNVDQRTGFVYWGEVGPDAGSPGERGPMGYDEVNQARAAGNFGWPYFIANNKAYADVDFETGKIGERYDPSHPINRSPNNTGAEILPPAQEAFIYYPYGDSKEFPELGKGGRTACAGPVYHYDDSLGSKTKLHKHYDNTLFIFEWTRHWIKAVHLDDDSNIKSIEPFMASRNFRRPIDIEFGPDGAMYLIEYGETWGVNQDAKLVRIDYVSGNRTPRAIASVKNNVGREPLVVELSSEGSFDKDEDDALQYEWVRVEGQGDQATRTTISRAANPSVTFEKTGVFTVELLVTDQAGARATASVPVLVGNTRPTVEIREPKSGFFEPGSMVGYEIFVNDYEDGTNDFDLADEQDLTEIDGDSSGRASMNARKLVGRFGGDSDEMMPVGLRLMKNSDCFNCHDVHAKRVGPPLLEVSKKYRDDPHALAKSVERVSNGSTGVWGKVPMIPHKQHSQEEIHQMVNWVYSLRDEGGLQVVRGFVGEIATDEEKYSGAVELSASYTDLGAGDIPPITTTSTIRLRSRHIEAEHANELHGPKAMNSKKASGEKFLGSIDHGHYIRLDAIDTDAVSKVTARVATGGAGGVVEFRGGSVDGPILAYVIVKENEAWEEFEDVTADFANFNGVQDLFVVFANKEKPGGLMNLDSIYFHP